MVIIGFFRDDFYVFSASFYRFYIAWRSFASGEAYFSYFFDITKTGDFLFLVAKFQMV